MQRDFTFFVTKKAIGFAVTICAAYLLRNFWAFVIGGLASAFGALFLSYAMHPYRPRLSLSRLKPMLSISVWLLIRNIGIYAQSRMDQILLAGRLSASDLGIYRMGTELASMPTSEILAPLGRVLLPAFSKITTDLGRLRAAFYKSLGTIAIVGIPAAVGLALVAEPFVYVVLGEKWLGVVDSLRILAMVELIMTLRYVAATVLFSMGQVRLITALTWLEVVVFVVVCTGGWFELTLVNVALTRVAASSVSTLLVLVRIVGTGVARTGELFVVLARPVVASLVMVAAVLIVQRLEIPSHILALLLQTAVGAASFSLSLVLIWLVSGRPESAERFILETAGLQLRKLLR